MTSAWPFATLALIGAYHGLNPGMGWLFALSLGLQEKRRQAVAWALVPISLGHAAAVVLTILALYLIRQVLSMPVLKIAVAVALFALGLYRLFRACHLRGGGLRVGSKDLFVWSFLMAGAHGAGLMLAPILMAQPALAMDHAMHHGALEVGTSALGTLGLAVIAHTLGLLSVALVLALIVYQSYERSGLRLLQKAWFNFDLLWAVALFIAALAALLI